MNFFDSRQCGSRKNCKKCRTDLQYRQTLKKIYIDIEDENFKCPFNIVKKSHPNIIIIIKNFILSLFKIIQSLFGENKLFSSKREFVARKKVCRHCFHYCHSTSRCSVCGCLINIKARIKVEECPKHYW